MQLKINLKQFATAFSHVSPVCPSRSPKPILQSVRMSCQDGITVLSATDADVSVQIELPVQGEQGECLLPVARTIQILRELRTEDITIEWGEGWVTIHAGATTSRGGTFFRQGTESAAEFPVIAGFTDSNFLQAQCKQIKNAIRRTVFATDEASSRYALGGVLWEIDGATLTTVGTDSRRLAIQTCEITGDHETPSVAPVVPAKAMRLAETSLPDGDSEAVRVAFHANDVVMSSGPVTIWSRLVEGRFPRWADVVPKRPKINVPLTVNSLRSTVRQALIFTNDESRGVDFDFADGNLVLTSQAADVGQSRIELPIAYSGDPITIRFDPRYVADCLKTLDDETPISLRMTDSDSAAMIETEDGYRYVLMPLERDKA